MIYVSVSDNSCLFLDSRNHLKETLREYLEFFRKTRVIHDSYYSGFLYCT